MVRKALVAIVAVIPSPSMAQEEAWASLGFSGGSQVFADFASVRVSPPIEIAREFAVRKVWIKMDHRGDKTVKARTTLMYVAIDCDDRRAAVLQNASYSAAGDVIASTESPDASYSYKAIIPGTTMMEARKWVCQLPARIEK